MVCIMVGKKLFMAFAEEFLELCRVLSCQSVQASPVHSDISQTSERKHPKTANSISEIILSEEMGNSPSKIKETESSVDQEYVLNILREEKAPLKESKFSPYTPLPAIGQTNFENPTHQIKRIVRQETYRVLNPVYIKGPFDVYKFPSVKDRLAVEDSGFRKKTRTSLDIRNQGEDRNNYNLVSNSKNKRKDCQQPKSDFEKLRLKSKNNIIKNRHLEPNLTNNDNSSAFWIDF